MDKKNKKALLIPHLGNLLRYSSIWSLGEKKEWKRHQETLQIFLYFFIRLSYLQYFQGRFKNC